jgi:hypothetical protein
MKIRRIAVAAATLAISTGTAMAETEGYVYTDPLPRWTNFAGSSSTPTRQELPMRAIVNGHNVQPRDDRRRH